MSAWITPGASYLFRLLSVSQRRYDGQCKLDNYSNLKRVIHDLSLVWCSHGAVDQRGEYHARADQAGAAAGLLPKRAQRPHQEGYRPVRLSIR